MGYDSEKESHALQDGNPEAIFHRHNSGNSGFSISAVVLK
jgi:hypothetical protein